MKTLAQIQFTNGLTQKEKPELANGFVELVNMDLSEVGVAKTVKTNEQTIVYGDEVHSLIFGGLQYSNPMLAGVGTSLYYGHTALKSNFSGEHWSSSAQGNKMYFCNLIDGLWEYDGSSVHRAGSPVPSTPTAASHGTGVGFTGDYTVYVTFTNRNGFDSNPSLGSSFTVADDDIDVTSIPINTDPDYDIVGRKLWIEGGTDPAQPTPVLLYTIDDNTTTSVTAIATIEDDQTALETDHDLPPDGDGCVSHYGVLWIWSGNSLYFSKTLEQESFPAANALTISKSGDPLMRCISWNGSLHCFTRRTAQQVIGSPGSGTLLTNFYVKQTKATKGTIAPRSVVPTPYGVFYQAEDGLRVYDGENSELVSNPCEDEIGARNQLDVPEALTVGHYFDDKLFMSFASGSENTPNRTLIYDFRTKVWSVDDTGYNDFASDEVNNTLQCATDVAIERWRTGSGYRSWSFKTNDITSQIDSYTCFNKFQMDYVGSMTVDAYMDDALVQSYSLSKEDRGLEVRDMPKGLNQRAALRAYGDASSVQTEMFSLTVTGEAQRGMI